MKRCPKCNRTYTDDNQKFCTHDGGRLMADKDAPTAQDLSETIQASSFDLGSAFDATQVDVPAPPPPTPPVQAKPAPPQPDLISTLPGNTPIPTSDFRRAGETGPTSAPTSASLTPPPNVVPTSESLSPPPPLAPTSARLPPPPAYAPEPMPQQQPQPQPQSAPYTPQVAAPPKRKSKLPLILGGLAVLLLLGVAALAAVYVLVVKPRMEASNQPTRPVVVAKENTNANANTNTGTANTNTQEASNSNTNSSENLNVGGGSFEAPPNSKRFVNSSAKLNGKLAEHYVDFSFYYPDTWTLDPTAGVAGASNFVGVGRKMQPNLLQENLTIGWYESKGTVEADRTSIENLIQSYSNKLSQIVPGYEKVSQGETKINSMDGYEFRFKGHGAMVGKSDDADYWGRVIFLPTGKEGEKNGVTLLMLTTSVAPELSGVDDVGVKGQLPVILNTFKFGK